RPSSSKGRESYGHYWISLRPAACAAVMNSSSKFRSRFQGLLSDVSREEALARRARSWVITSGVSASSGTLDSRIRARRGEQAAPGRVLDAPRGLHWSPGAAPRRAQHVGPLVP